MYCYLERHPKLAPEARNDLLTALRQVFMFETLPMHVEVKYRTIITIRGITFESAILQLDREYLQSLKDGSDFIQPV